MSMNQLIPPIWLGSRFVLTGLSFEIRHFKDELGLHLESF